MERPVIKEPI